MVKEITIAIISLVVGYFISRIQEILSEKHTRKEERFQKLYAPFVKMIWLHTHGAFQFSELDPSLQRQFFELLFNNYEYADSELKALLLQFKWTYDTPSAEDVADADRHFFLIEERITTVFNVLCKDLFLEPYSIKHADKIAKQLEKLP
ncbi:MAG: hypothetical protein NC094_09065 [Bacteroidales bacterium]|nr:hypothetical protein [Lachnoclostridium sp.]MCM1385154.1 hypothetical protein [Lachnoclostridium sp.]MCM1465556.1 hypothetical protein [Bacteroidales bacterium]